MNVDQRYAQHVIGMQGPGDDIHRVGHDLDIHFAIAQLLQHVSDQPLSFYRWR